LALDHMRKKTAGFPAPIKRSWEEKSAESEKISLQVVHELRRIQRRFSRTTWTRGTPDHRKAWCNRLRQIKNIPILPITSFFESVAARDRIRRPSRTCYTFMQKRKISSSIERG
jgi:hypothetical protein